MSKLLQYVHNMYSDNCNLQFAFALHVLEIRIKAWQTLLGNILDSSVWEAIFPGCRWEYMYTGKCRFLY